MLIKAFRKIAKINNLNIKTKTLIRIFRPGPRFDRVTWISIQLRIDDLDRQPTALKFKRQIPF